jgi:hypothetical protein
MVREAWAMAEREMSGSALPTVADLYRNRNPGNAQSTLRRIAGTVNRSGPLLVDGAILSGWDSGEGWGLQVDMERALDEFARYEQDGYQYFDKARIPPDEELSRIWGIPLASGVIARAETEMQP